MAIEYAVVLPLMLMFSLGIVDLGRYFWSVITLARSVATASRCVAVNTTTLCNAANRQAYAATQAFGLSPAPTYVFTTVTTPIACAKVVGTMTFNFFTPWFYVAAPFGANNSVTLTSTACYPT